MEQLPHFEQLVLSKLTTWDLLTAVIPVKKNIELFESDKQHD